MSSLVPSEQVIAILSDIKSFNPKLLKNGDPTLENDPVLAVRNLINECTLLVNNLSALKKTIKIVGVTEVKT